MRYAHRRSLALFVAPSLLATVAAAADDAGSPVGVQAAETVVKLPDHGRLFPAFGHLDGDAKLDLVVGVTWKSGGGRLLVYLNAGTNAQRLYENPLWLDERVPSARIPDG